MEIQTRKEKNAVIISVKGRMDAVTAPEFEKSLSDFISKGELSFLLNFGGLEYISSAGLRSILATAKKLKEKQGKIALPDCRAPWKRFSRYLAFIPSLRSLTQKKRPLKRFD